MIKKLIYFWNFIPKWSTLYRFILHVWEAIISVNYDDGKLLKYYIRMIKKFLKREILA